MQPWALSLPDKELCLRVLIFYSQALFSQETFISVELGLELEDTQMKKTEFLFCKMLLL